MSLFDSSYALVLAKHRDAHRQLVARWELKPGSFEALQKEYKRILGGIVPVQLSRECIAEYTRYHLLSTTLP